MGHEIREVAFPGNEVRLTEQLRASLPSVEDLNSYDVLLCTYFEYLQPWLQATYGDTWQQIRVPIVARFDESMDRTDLGLPTRIPELKKWAAYFSFPAAQDAKKFGGDWHPFGADTEIFHPIDYASAIRVTALHSMDVGFIGSMYPNRQAYLQKLLQHLRPDILFRYGNVFVQDLDGPRQPESTYVLADNYRRLKIFFCLPPLSRLVVEKVFDVMACDTLVLYPRLYGDAEVNLSLFEHEREIVYYDVGYFANNAKQVHFFLDHKREREGIARAGGELIRSKYTLEALLQNLIDVAKGANRETVSKSSGCASA